MFLTLGRSGFFGNAWSRKGFTIFCFASLTNALKNRDLEQTADRLRMWTHAGRRSGIVYIAAIKITSTSTEKFIRKYRVTSAQVHDFQCFTEMIDKRATSRKVWADCTYMSAANILEVEKKKWVPLICEKGCRNHPLSDAKKQENQQKSRIRCRIEHVFAWWAKLRVEVARFTPSALLARKWKFASKI